jgi:hypothetical protein
MMMMIECCVHSYFFSWLIGLFLRQFTFILVILNISNFATMVFLYSVYIFFFWDKKGEYFYFSTGIVFLTGQVIFVPEWQNREFVSFIGCILLTKSLSCNVVLTRIPHYFRIIKYSEIISLIWKWPYYDKFQCHKLQEGNFRVPGRFWEVFNSAKVRSLVPVRTVQWNVRMPSYVEKILTAQRASVWTLGQHHSDALQCSRRIQISFADTNWEDSLQTSGR